MFYDVLSHFQHTFRVQQDSVALMSASQYSQVTPRIEMVVGDWYLDEFGNPTREIKARDELLGA
jgi:hypothetical protein